MTDDVDGQAELFDGLVEQTDEGPEQGQPDVSQDPAWRPPNATESAV